MDAEAAGLQRDSAGWDGGEEIGENIQVVRTEREKGANVIKQILKRMCLRRIIISR